MQIDYHWFFPTWGGGHFGAEEVNDITELARSHTTFRRLATRWKKRDVLIIAGTGQAIRWALRHYTLNKKWQMSPSAITYDLPSTRSFPAARIAASVLWASRSSSV